MVDDRHTVIKYLTIVLKRSAVNRYELGETAAGTHSSAIDALDLAVSSGMVAAVFGTFSKAVFITKAPQPTNGGESSLSVRTRSDANESGTRQLYEDINQACIAAGRFDAQLFFATLCYCDYPQPLDADFINVNIDQSLSDGVKRNTTLWSKDCASLPDSKISASSSSWWQRSRNFVTDFVVYVPCHVCLCC